MKYILINWPQSQKFMEDNRCFSCIEIEGAIFVPEDLYCRTTGHLHRFSWTVKNEELQNILSQYPKDATVAVEYCDVKNLKYFPDRNFIAID